MLFTSLLHRIAYHQQPKSRCGVVARQCNRNDFCNRDDHLLSKFSEAGDALKLVANRNNAWKTCTGFFRARNKKKRSR